MNNKEIYDVSGNSCGFDLSFLKESEKLVHWVKSGGGFTRVENPNGTEFFVGTFAKDRDAFDCIQDIKAAVLSGADGGEKFKDLCVRLDGCLPVIEGIKYVMPLELAYYLVRTHRPMDDIYFYQNKSNRMSDGAGIIEFVSGRYAS